MHNSAPCPCFNVYMCRARTPVHLVVDVAEFASYLEKRSVAMDGERVDVYRLEARPPDHIYTEWAVRRSTCAIAPHVATGWRVADQSCLQEGSAAHGLPGTACPALRWLRFERMA